MSIRLMSAGWASDSPCLDTPAKMGVWLALADSTNDDTGKCWPSVAQLAAKARMSERNVSRMLSEFEANGMIVRQLRYKRSTVYTLVDPSAWPDRLSPQKSGDKHAALG